MYNNHVTAHAYVNMSYTKPSIKNWRILLQQSFTAHMPLPMANSAFELGGKMLAFSSPVLQWALAILDIFS